LYNKILSQTRYRAISYGEIKVSKMDKIAGLENAGHAIKALLGVCVRVTYDLSQVSLSHDIFIHSN